MVLKNREGHERCSHEDKAAILWEAYKERLGSSEFIQIHFDLNDLLHADDNLDDVGAPFTKNEIDAIVLNLPSKKSPGSDGFNSNFIKKCWRIIASDFYELCFGFYENICL
jgi:hypothetical protein